MKNGFSSQTFELEFEVKINNFLIVTYFARKPCFTPRLEAL